MGLKIKIIIFLSFFLSITYAQVAPRVSGLENNEQYMELLQEEYELQRAEDSLTTELSSVRQKLRIESADRNEIRNDILRLEGEIFDVRNRIGIVAGKINFIEQEFILNNIGIITTSTDNNTSSTDKYITENSSNLVNNDFIRLKIEQADYEALLDAQAKESSVVSMINSYRNNYNQLLEIKQTYDSVRSETEADSLWQKYQTLYRLNATLSDSVKTLWGKVYDNKTYVYNYLLDKLNEMELLADFEKKSMQLRDDIAGMRGKVASVDISSYPLQKKHLLDYEKSIAQIGDLKRSLDSLSLAEKAFGNEVYFFPAIDMKERLFLDFHDISIHTPAKYTASKPIPNLKIYDKGVIYRILLGSYTRTQPISVFKGVYPLGLVREGNSYNYYAGGFENFEKAEQAVEQLKKAGFRNPKIAVWSNGYYSLPENDASGSASGESTLRIEIETNSGELSEEIKAVLTEQAPDIDISRIGMTFIIGPFESEIEAVKLADKLRSVESGELIKISSALEN